MSSAEPADLHALDVERVESRGLLRLLHTTALHTPHFDEHPGGRIIAAKTSRWVTFQIRDTCTNRRALVNTCTIMIWIGGRVSWSRSISSIFTVHKWRRAAMNSGPTFSHVRCEGSSSVVFSKMRKRTSMATVSAPIVRKPSRVLVHSRISRARVSGNSMRADSTPARMVAELGSARLVKYTRKLWRNKWRRSTSRLPRKAMAI